MKDLVSLSANILIVEDETDLLDVMTSEMSLYFSEIHGATNGIEAQEIIQRGMIDAIVTDYRMPKMNGLELIAWVKKHNPMIPVIMLTANRNNPEVLAALVDGAFDILDKPFRIEVLANRVQNSLVYPKLIKLLWTVMSAEYPIPKMEEIARLPFKDQLKTLNAFSALLETRALK